MANNDWDLDDLLEFHFDREVPDRSKKIDDIDEDRKLYEELRRKSKSSNAPAFDVPEPLSNHKWIDDDDIFAQYDREHAFSRKSESAPVEEVDEHPHHRRRTTGTEATIQKTRARRKRKAEGAKESAASTGC